LSEPKLLILDEPTSGLDANLTAEMHDLFRAIADGPRRPAVLFVTHEDSEFAQIDKIIAVGKAADSDEKTATVRYFGPPDRLLETFGVGSFRELFSFISNPVPGSKIEPSVTRPKGFGRPYKTLNWGRSFRYNLRRQWLLFGGFKGLAKLLLSTMGL